MIAINQDSLGISVKRVGEPQCGASVHVFAGPLAGGDIVVTLFNHIPTTFCQTALVVWEDVGFSANAVVSVRDLWLHQDMGLFIGSYSAGPIVARGTIVLRLSEILQ